jgi:inorganic pyrophosphatase
MVVEIPKGSRNKYEMDHRLERIRLSRMLFTSTRYPVDYGFIPNTLAEDGDPLDIMVLLEDATFPGIVVDVRPVGLFWMSDEAGPDAKILAVPSRDPRYTHIQELRHVSEHPLAEIRHFFEIYKQLEPGKGTDVRGWQDRLSAEREITDAQKRWAGTASAKPA